MTLRSRFTSSFREHPWRTFLGVSALLVLVLYWQAFRSPFVYDDLDQIVNNANLATWHGFAQRFLLRPVALSTSLLAYTGSIYRPLFWLSLFLDRAVWGLDAGAFHATNLLLHLLNGALAFALLRRLKMSAPTAAASVLLWLALPTNAEVVAWVSARSYELCTAFVLCCLLAAGSYLRTGRVLWLAACVLCSLAAGLSHELGLVSVPLVALLLLGDRTESLARRLLPAAAALVGAVAVEALRARAGAKTLSTPATLRWTALAGGKYITFPFFPFHLSVERSTSLPLQHAHPLAALPWVLFFVAFWFALRSRHKSTLPLAGLVWFLIGIAPFCLLMNYQGLAERFDYLASLGLVVAVFSIFPRLQSTARRRALAVAMVAWAVWSGVRTELRAADWADPVQLYRHSLAATPQSPSLHFNLAYSLRQQGQLAEALAEYRRVLDLSPGYPHVYASMGDVDLAMGAYAAAQASYQQALRHDPHDAAVLLNIGTAFSDAGDLAAAENSYQRLLQIAPASSAAHTDLGVLYVGQHRTDEAMHQFAMAIDLKTMDPTPYYDLAVLLQQGGRGDLALVLYKKVLALKPDDENTLRNIALLQQGH